MGSQGRARVTLGRWPRSRHLSFIQAVLCGSGSHLCALTRGSLVLSLVATLLTHRKWVTQKGGSGAETHLERKALTAH